MGLISFFVFAKHRPSLKVIVMSAQNTLLTAVKANERGAYEYLPKPFDLSELIAVVDRGLRDVSEISPANRDETSISSR